MVAYPKLASYSAMYGNGAPFIKPVGVQIATPGDLWIVEGGDTLGRWSASYDSITGVVIDTALVEAQARYDYAIMEPYRVGPNAEVQRMLKRLNPAMTLLAFHKTGKYFVCGSGWSGGEVPMGCDTTGANAAWSRWVVIRAHDAVLYGKRGPYLGGGWIDFARPGLAEALADTIAAWVP